MASASDPSTPPDSPDSSGSGDSSEPADSTESADLTEPTESTASSGSPGSRRSVPSTIQGVAGLVALEAAAVIGYGIWNVADTLQTPNGSLEAAFASALFLFLVGIALAIFAYGMIARLTWMRAAVVVIQLLVVPISAQLLSTAPVPAAGVLLTACAVLVLIFLRPSTRYFAEQNG